MQTIGFGEGADERQAYKNRRAEMYGTLQNYLNPNREAGVFALPPTNRQLRQELAVFPLQYDSEGRMFLPPKDHDTSAQHTGPSLRRLLGHSPDRADSLVLAVWQLDKCRVYEDISKLKLVYDYEGELTPKELEDLPEEFRKLLEMDLNLGEFDDD